MRNTDSKTDHDHSSLKIIWAAVTLSIIVGIFLKRTNWIISVDNGLLFYYSGIGFICLGLIVRWMAILKLKKSFTVNVSVSEEQVIVKTGIYKWIRHPAYTGSLLSFAGLGLTFNNWLTFFVIIIPILMAFLYRIKIEEKILSRAFGKQYHDYAERTRKLIPWVY